MRILMVDKYYFVKGGAERYLFELSSILSQKGHQVIPFAMRHPRNFPTPFEKYFVSQIEFNGIPRSKKITQGLRIVRRVIYSKEAQVAIRRLIEDYRPDVAHLHMIDHQLSPSILEPLRRKQIPVVQTCHQYKHVCPSYRLFLMDKQQICERCIGGKFYHAVLQRCHKSSVFASSLVAVESYVHRSMRVYDAVDRFHVPSRFLGEKLKQGGFPASKIWHAFYAINVRDYPFFEDEDDYCLYFGRISEEKGLPTLLKAMSRVHAARLMIVGEGPYLPQVRAQIQELGLADRVKLAGRLDGERLIQAIGKSRFVIVPSEWYENSPLVIYEAFSIGKPVIGSRIGGIPELVDHGRNGMLFAAGDSSELAAHIRTLWSDESLRKEFGRNARAKAEQELDFSVHYPRIVNLYRSVIAS